VRALRRFTVRAALPEALAPLGDLVMNLRWSWHPDSLDLFESVDPETWAAVEHDPVKLLGAVDSGRMAALAKDRKFLRRLSDAYDDLQDYLDQPRWYQSLDDVPRSIAYFSPEFGITEVLPQYSGGLGILAGDHLKAASDLGVPIIGVGLLYRRGYFKQSLSPDGWQQERYPPLDPNGLPLTLLREPGEDGREGPPVRVAVGKPGDKVLRAQIWRAQVGRVPLLMLDSDIEDNAPPEREVTDRLYGGGTDHRLHQEVLLGIGGVRALRVFCQLTGHPEPEVFHTNEGHAGFLGIERIRELTEDQGLSWDEALAAVRAGTVFTTHTPVPAGIDRFPRELIAEYFGGDNASKGVPVDRILELGAEVDPEMFNMAHMGLRLAERANGVSKLHGRVSREMFGSLWPGFDAADVPIASVTNGVHAPTWVARQVMEIGAKQVGRELVEEAQGWEGIAKVSDETVWSTRRELRAGLVDEVRRRLRESWLQRGASEAGLGWIDNVFDPDVLTIGFARRLATYKRLNLLLQDVDRAIKLVGGDRPIQVLLAGKAHPRDDQGKALVQGLFRMKEAPNFANRVAYLDDYDLRMASYLVRGCDVWINLPRPPLEASGTSGMKNVVNGGLHLSVLDGWWAEGYDGSNGWALSGDVDHDHGAQDARHAAELFRLLEDEVGPEFYERGGSGIPKAWLTRVRNSLRTCGPEFGAGRMLEDYEKKVYRP
jgi:starch phosphorylase